MASDPEWMHELYHLLWYPYPTLSSIQTCSTAPILTLTYTPAPLHAHPHMSNACTPKNPSSSRKHPANTLPPSRTLSPFLPQSSSILNLHQNSPVAPTKNVSCMSGLPPLTPSNPSLPKYLIPYTSSIPTKALTLSHSSTSLYPTKLRPTASLLLSRACKSCSASGSLSCPFPPRKPYHVHPPPQACQECDDRF